MNIRSKTHTLEIFSGSLLTKRRDWQRMTRELPADGCLLIIQADNTSQAQLVHRLGRAFHAQGRRVFVLKVE